MGLLCAQPPETPPPSSNEPKRLPDGRLMSEAVRRQDQKDNLADLEQIRKLTEAIREDLEKTEGHALSLKSLKNLDEIERVTRRMRSRMRR